jgi:hypothetical protein
VRSAARRSVAARSAAQIAGLGGATARAIEPVGERGGGATAIEPVGLLEIEHRRLVATALLVERRAQEQQIDPRDAADRRVGAVERGVDGGHGRAVISTGRARRGQLGHQLGRARHAMRRRAQGPGGRQRLAEEAREHRRGLAQARDHHGVVGRVLGVLDHQVRQRLPLLGVAVVLLEAIVDRRVGRRAAVPSSSTRCTPAQSCAS